VLLIWEKSGIMPPSADSRRQMTEVRIQKSEYRRQMTEVRIQKSEYRRQNLEDKND